MAEDLELPIPKVQTKYSTIGPYATRHRENTTQAVKPHEITVSAPTTIPQDAAPINASNLQKMNNLVRPNLQTIHRNLPYKDREQALRQENHRIISDGPRPAPEIARNKYVLPSRKTCENVAPLQQPQKVFE